MNKHVIALIIYIISYSYVFSHSQLTQNSQAQIDSLNLAISENKHDTVVAQAYIKLAKIFYVAHPDTILFFSKKAISIVRDNLKKPGLDDQEKRTYQEIIASALCNIGFAQHIHGEYSLALKSFMEALEIFKRIKDKNGIAEAYIGIGAMNNFLGEVDKALMFYQDGLKIGQELGAKDVMATALNNIGYIHKKQGEFKLALDYYKKSLIIHQNNADKPNIANTCNNIGVVYRDLGDYDKAVEYLQNGLKIQEEIGYKKGMASTYGNLGHISNLQGDISLALDYYHKALKIREEIGEKSSIAISQNSIGSIYQDQGDADLALEYYQQALKIYLESGEKKGIAESLRNIGQIYQELGELSLSLENHQKALEIQEQLKDNSAISRTLNYIGLIYLDQNDYTEALKHFQRSLRISEDIGEKIGIARSNTYIGSVYYEMGDNIITIQHGKKALDITQELGAVKDIKMASALLYDAYKSAGRFAYALQMHELFIEMRDSLLNEANTKAVIVKEMNYKHEKELQAERLALAEERHENEIRQQKKNQRTYASIGLMVIIGIFGYFMLRYRARKKELLRQKKHSEKLEHIDRLKDQFLANTSHELRTPLQGIIGLSETLLDQEKDKRKKQELGMIISAGKRLASLVNSILDFSKLKTHELRLSPKAIDLRTICNSVLLICRSLIKGKSIVFINDIDPSVPLVNADEDRIYQVLHNLIGNAIKFTSEGEIAISARSEKEMVEVCVKDTGIGIPEDKLEDVFKSFEQVDASITREQGGAGLGLTITKKLIELHGGSIWIESQIDVGTSIFFTLPISAEEETTIREYSKLSRIIPPIENIDDNRQPIDQSSSLNGSQFIILIVDDESINHQVLSNHLNQDNFRIHQAMNGPEALAILNREKPDLILLDIMMPKMSGYEVCKEIRKKYLPSELPIIMITAKDQVPDLVEGLALGANDYLAKPFSKDELLARLKTHLNLYHINSAYLRFIPKEFLKALGRDSIIDVSLGDQVQGDMTILFSDIRYFTSITEKLNAKESFEFLNEVLNSITPAITTNGGFIDKYIGDAVMALFPEHPEDAVISAIQIQKKLAEYNVERAAHGKEKVKIGIGIHTGPLMLGTIGVKDRMDGTVISDAVNLASRLEELNKLYGTSLIVSNSTVQMLNRPDRYHCRFLSYARVKGKQNAIKVYEFFDGDEDYDKSLKLKTLLTFNEGIREYYLQKFTKASVKFQDVIDIYPEDKTARLFLEKSAKFMVHGVPDDWDGVDIVEKVF